MNVAQYKPSNTMTTEAVARIRRTASLNRAARPAGLSEHDSDAGGQEAYHSPRTIETHGATFECDFSRDGACRIVKCETAAAEVGIPSRIDGHDVTVIGPHSFSTCYSLKRVNLPDSVMEIGEYAFMNTALEALACPAALRRIGKNAFYKCARLRSASLNEGLEFLGESAFRESALGALDIPASVTNIGRDAFLDTRLTFSGAQPSLSMAKENPCYGLLDGALYKAGENGLELVQVLDAGIKDYTGPQNLAEVGSHAFAGLKELERVSLPEGLVHIGQAAFKGCRKLSSVDLPDTIASIDDHAFNGTALASLRIPAQLQWAGEAAFYTGGSIARSFERTIRRIEVSPDNESFYLNGSMLCQRGAGAGGGDIALLYIGDERRVVIPREITAIGPYAFLKAENVTELHIHDGIAAIDMGGFDFGHAVTTVVYDVYRDAEPGKRYVIAFPAGQAGRQAVRQTFARGYFDLGFAYASADNAVLITQDHLIRSKAMLERLRNPVMLDDSMRAEYERKLARTLPATIVAFGRGGFTQGIDLLFEQGTINRDTIDAAIDAAIGANEIAALSRLMELKRVAFEGPLFDFDL